LIFGVGELELEFSFFGAEHDRLALHAADHIKRSLGLAAQRHLEQVLRDAGFHGFAQFGLDLEEAIGRTKSFDALMGTLVVVILNPEPDAITRGLEALELSAIKELLPDGGPEALDLAQGHRMVRSGLEVGHAIFLEFGFETRSPAPGGVLPAIIGEHLLGRLKLTDTLAIDFDDGVSGGTAEEIRGGDKTRIIVEERNEIGVAAAQPEGENIRLPHLVGSSALEEARAC